RLLPGYTPETIEPERDLVEEGADVGLADRVEVRWEDPARRIEEAAVDWSGGRGADELGLGRVVGGDHPGVGGGGVGAGPLPLQAVPDGVDPVGDHEQRPVRLLGEEIAQRPVEAPGEADLDSLLRHQGEGARDAEHSLGVVGQEQAPGRRDREVAEALVFIGDEVQDAGDGLVVHEEKDTAKPVSPVGCFLRYGHQPSCAETSRAASTRSAQGRSAPHLAWRSDRTDWNFGRTRRTSWGVGERTVSGRVASQATTRGTTVSILPSCDLGSHAARSETNFR